MADATKSFPVYSTARGSICRGCGRPEAHCACRTGKAPLQGDGVVRVGRETKGRKGKGVTIVTGVPLAGDALRALAADLRRFCGSGGTLRDGIIEIQGEHRDRLTDELQRRGYRVKRAGG